MPKNREQHLLSDLAAMEADYLSGARDFEAFLDRWAETISEIQTALTEDFLSDHAIELISDTFNIVLAPAARVHQAICEAESGIVDDVADVLADLALFSQEEEGEDFVEEPDPPNPLQEWLIANISHPFATSPEATTDFLELVGLSRRSFDEWLSGVRATIGWNKLAEQLVNGDRTSMQTLVQIVLEGSSNVSKDLLETAKDSRSQILELKERAAAYRAFPMPAWLEEALRQLEKIRDSPDYHFDLDDLDESLWLEDESSLMELPASPLQQVQRGPLTPIEVQSPLEPSQEVETKSCLKRKRDESIDCSLPSKFHDMPKVLTSIPGSTPDPLNSGHEHSISISTRPCKRRHLEARSDDGALRSAAILLGPIDNVPAQRDTSPDLSSPSSVSSAASSPSSASSGSESGSPISQAQIDPDVDKLHPAQITTDTPTQKGVDVLIVQLAEDYHEYSRPGSSTKRILSPSSASFVSTAILGDKSKTLFPANQTQITIKNVDQPDIKTRPPQPSTISNDQRKRCREDNQSTAGYGRSIGGSFVMVDRCPKHLSDLLDAPNQSSDGPDSMSSPALTSSSREGVHCIGCRTVNLRAVSVEDLRPSKRKKLTWRDSSDSPIT
ncbi:hypothetical protein FRC17_000926 [Serendipita sp. 399]|nr:hypothetical protein FRC17_000926 [Serendipita sp. 399]